MSMSKPPQARGAGTSRCCAPGARPPGSPGSPTSPRLMGETRRWNPARVALRAPDSPRSSSMTTQRGTGQPSTSARSANCIAGACSPRAARPGAARTGGHRPAPGGPGGSAGFGVALIAPSHRGLAEQQRELRADLLPRRRRQAVPEAGQRLGRKLVAAHRHPPRVTVRADTASAYQARRVAGWGGRARRGRRRVAERRASAREGDNGRRAARGRRPRR